MHRFAVVTTLGLTMFATAGCGPAIPTLPPVEQPPEPATVPVTPEPETAGFEIVTHPPALVLVDGRNVGTSPVTVTGLPAGVHDITFVDRAKREVTVHRSLAVGEFKSVHYHLPDPEQATP